MTVKELHIGIDVGLQGIRSEINDGLLPEEKDFLLNKSRNEFIYEKLDRNTNTRNLKHHNSKIRITDLERLSTAKNITTFKKEENIFCGILPSNYLENIIIEAETYCKSNVICKNNNIDNSNLETSKLFYSVYKIDSSINQFKDFKLSVFKDNNEIVLFNLADYNKFLNGFNEEEEVFYLIEYILDIVNSNTDYEVYYETFNDLFFQNSFIIVSKEDYDYINIFNSNNIILEKKEFVYSYYKSDKNFYYYDCRLVNEEDIKDILKNSFSKSVYNSPICIIKNGLIYIYSNKYVILNIKLSYYKKPRIIDYKLNRTCELTSNNIIGQIIVNKVVERVLGYTNSDTYQQAKIEHNLINNN